MADDVRCSSVNRVREALAKHMDVCLLAFIRQPKLNTEQIQDAIYLDSSGISYRGNFVILGAGSTEQEGGTVD